MEAVMGRRNFMGYLTGAAILKYAGAFGVGGIMVAESACNATDVWHEIEAWVPSGIQGFDAIVSIINPVAGTAIAAAASLVQAAFSSVSAAIDEYLNAPAASKASLAGKVKLVLQSLGDNIQTFLTSIGQSPNPVLKVVGALIGVLVNVIGGFINKITGAAAATARLFRQTFELGGKTITVTPTYMNRKQFIAAFNSTADAEGWPQCHIPPTK